MDTLDSLAHAIHQSLQNQLVGGGLVLMLWGALLALCRKLPGQLALLIQRQVSTSAEVLDSSEAFRWLAVWLDQQPYARTARRVTMTVNQRDDPPRVMFTPAPGLHWFWYAGRLVSLQRQRRDLSATHSPIARTVAEAFVIHVLGRDQAPVRALIAEAREVAERRAQRVTVFMSSAAQWMHVREYTPRALDTVVLPEGLADDLLGDVREFLEGREWYAARGIPWRRGYLLHGLPGTGKSALISALCGEAGFNQYLVDLSGTGMSDEALARLLLSVPSRTAVVFEDVDAVLDGRRVVGASMGGGVTFSGLLNALDGTLSQSGITVWLTTNHLDRLDPALVRPGRVDCEVCFTHATPDQIVRLFLNFYGATDEMCALGTRYAARMAPQQVTMAEVQQHLLHYKENPVQAVGAASVQPTEMEGWPAGTDYSNGSCIRQKIHTSI